MSRSPGSVTRGSRARGGISSFVGGGLISNARWRGVSLPSLLQTARLQPGARQVDLRSVDGYTVSATIDEARDPAALVACEMNGERLPDRHGTRVSWSLCVRFEV